MNNKPALHADLVISARWIVPVHPRKVLENHSLAIADGKILALLPTEDIAGRVEAREHLMLKQHVLIPGLINSHTHAAMNLLRGIADDLPLKTWLEEHIWPVEGRWLSDPFVADGSRLAIAEMLRGGITTFNDMYLFPETTARCALETGIRANIGLVVIDFPTPWATDAEECLHKGLTLADEIKHEPLVNASFAPHAPYTVSASMLKRIGVLASELDIPVHMHIHETAGEIEQCLAQSGKRPLALLEELGLVTPLLQAVHMTHLEDNEMQLLRERRCSVIHCPESNLKLASGICPVASLSSKGVNVALGTDGVASNNDLDMFGEMRSAALLAKIHNQNATALAAHEVLEMATINGARALGIDANTGSLEIGKAADITAINLNRIETLPVYDPVSQLVYCCSREQVEHVWVAGRQLLRNRQLTTLDETELLATANAWQEKIASTA